MKVVILAGGFGTRLSEETTLKPKPMVEVGDRPILCHIMDIYSDHGYRDFVIACGYKGELIKEYFHKFYYYSSDFIVNLRDGTHEVTGTSAPDWRIQLVDTGLKTLTGGRLLRLREVLGKDTFMVTYGDGLGDIDITALVKFHKEHGKLATVTAVRPPARFGSLVFEGNRVSNFTEKPQTLEGWINGGFFVFEPQALDFIAGDDTALEGDPLENLARDGQLMVHFHENFWQPMDTLRDRNLLQSLWKSGKAPWRPNK